MKVGIVLNSTFNAVNFRSELIQKFIDKGHEVIIFAPNDGGVEKLKSKLDIQYFEFGISRGGLNPIKEFKYIIKLAKELRKQNIEMSLAYTIKPVLYTALACLLNPSIKVFSFITGLGYVYTGGSKKHIFLRRVTNLMYRLAFWRSSLSFFQNQDDVNYFVKRFLIGKNKVRITNGSGVNMKKFQYQGEEKIEKSFIFVGRLLFDKGVQEYLEACRNLKAKYSDAKFYIMGGLDNNPACISQETLDEFVNQNIVTHIPAGPTVRDELSTKEVFVLPSYREGTPRSTLEAMSMKMPIVTTKVPGCKETVLDGGNGYIVPHKSPKLLEEAIEKLILNRSLIEKMSQKSYELCSEKFEVSKVNDFIMDEIFKV